MTLENYFRVMRWRSEGRPYDTKSLAVRAHAWAIWIYRSKKFN